MILVEIFSMPGCGKCAQAREALKTVAASLPGVCWREVDILQELDYAVDLGVLSTPAIAIDGALVFATLPAAERLRQALVDRLERAPRGEC